MNSDQDWSVEHTAGREGKRFAPYDSNRKKGFREQKRTRCVRTATERISLLRIEVQMGFVSAARRRLAELSLNVFRPLQGGKKGVECLPLPPAKHLVLVFPRCGENS